MSDEELVALLVDDLEAWLEAGRPTESNDQRLTALWRLFDVLFALRVLLLPEEGSSPSLAAMVTKAQDELLSAQVVLERLRTAASRAIKEARGNGGRITDRTLADLELARS